MGPASDPMAVVDQWCHVHGLSGVRVADASIMPDVVRANRPKYSEATGRGNIASTHCFIDIFSPSSMRYAGLYGVASLPFLGTTLPKRITDSIRLSQHNPLLCLPWLLLALPKRRAFGKVSGMEKHRLLPQMTASLYLGHMGVIPALLRFSAT